jgi:hypothetical protein
VSDNASFSAPYNLPQPGAASVYGQGGGYLITGARDIMDAKRMMQAGYVPTAEYPDGYLGTINSRREDRLLDNIANRATQKSYQRGVHKGERIDPADYYWTDQVNPSVGLQYEARGKKWTQKGSFIGSKLVDDGKNLGFPGVTTPERFATAQMAYAHEMEPPFVAGVDEKRRQQQMRQYLPKWN